MYNRQEICSCRTLLEDRKEFIYRYFLVEGTKGIEVNGKQVVVPSYGISIVKEENLDGKTMCIDEDTVEVITSVRSKVEDLIGMLRDHEVSPVHLMDIVGEKADEWVCDFEYEASSLNSSHLFV